MVNVWQKCIFANPGSFLVPMFSVVVFTYLRQGKITVLGNIFYVKNIPVLTSENDVREQRPPACPCSAPYKWNPITTHTSCLLGFHVRWRATGQANYVPYHFFVVTSINWPHEEYHEVLKIDEFWTEVHTVCYTIEFNSRITSCTTSNSCLCLINYCGF